jgi:tRNA U34 5-methylaminomethyl-2-thiouridine-forming methyltransferase MnmC
MKKTLRLCEDGSHTLFSEKAGECYHSTHGAYTESMHIFINLGLRAVVESRMIKKNINGLSPEAISGLKTNIMQHSLQNTEPETKLNPIRILEVGFGTGLNALLTALEVEKNKITVSYLGLEPFPILPATLQQLNYCKFLSGKSEKLFTAMHASEWDTDILIDHDFYFRKQQIGFMEAELQKDGFDLIYFDAFSPEAQPELWEPKVFEKCFDVLEKGGILVTYCAKGVVKRALKSAGFIIENLPGPPGKREITRAHKLA